jgi:hypothetical protein
MERKRIDRAQSLELMTANDNADGDDESEIGSTVAKNDNS